MDTHSYWNHMISSQLIKCGKKLKGTHGRPYRNLLFVIVREFLTQMMEMDRLFRLHGSVYNSVVVKLLEQYDAQLLIRWYDVRQSKEYNVMIHNVQKFIDRWINSNLTDKNPQNISLITMIAWEKQKIHIIDTIIEPYMKRRLKTSKDSLKSVHVKKNKDFIDQSQLFFS